MKCNSPEQTLCLTTVSCFYSKELHSAYGACCELTFHTFCALIPNLEHLYKIEVLTHANAKIMFKRLQMFTLIVMTPLQFELSQSSSNSWQACQLALTLVTTEIMI